MPLCTHTSSYINYPLSLNNLIYVMINFKLFTQSNIQGMILFAS